MRVTLLTLTLLICHQALALPTTSVEASELQAYPVSSIEVPDEIATPQALNLRSSGHDKGITDLDTHSLQPRQLPWTANPLKAKLSVLLNTAAATALHVANGWLTWRFNLVYQRPLNTWSGTIYSTNSESASDVSVCINKFTETLTGNTHGILWSEGDVDFEGTWRSTATGKMVTVFWSATCRFYQTTTIGNPIASTIVEMIGEATGFQLQYDQNWRCTTTVEGGGNSLNFLESTFEGC